MRSFISSILEQYGFDVQEAANGCEALGLVPRGGYELVVADVNMPEVSGVELVRFIRGVAGYASVPVIVVSTDSQRHDIARALEAGATSFLAKPFGSEDLVAQIAQYWGPPAGIVSDHERGDR